MLIRKILQKVGEKNDVIWNLLTLDQLKFKFNALKKGVEENKKSKSNLFSVRRNIHRLEKALSYPVAKATFAEDYILETVNKFKHGIETSIFDAETVSWGTSVLSLYFKNVTSTPAVEQARKVFLGTVAMEETPANVPYLSSTRPIHNIQYDELLKLSVRRRSVRYFEDRKVDVATVQKAYEIAKYSPSACNRQSFQFLYFDDAETVKKLSKVPGGVAGYTLPSVIVVVGRYDGYNDIRDINAPVIDASLTSMSFLYAAETLGLGTVCINWPNLIDREESIRKIIDLKPYEFVIMLIGIGYPLDNGKVPYSAKRPSENVFLINDRIK
ncbi:nitroreductase [Filimonas zeae]|uniref:Nitroreductase domain-containing protein n=1 Tax=Filimonas zeae TaxID=1737353 RepID=A0A917MRN2_9BACT|nr:nitroreductase family protein [Filimonas zeae]MDR6336995.1 nitroreductase [Filimonas zeae]GGH56502.1 hypothetical protein GCM10011379_00160 [Filimonas zeae]